MSEKYEKLKTLLKELFQLDRPDLDFGLYRIMHAKAGEVTQFLERDLLPQVKASFGDYKSADKAGIERELAKAMEQANALGVDPETTQKVKDLRARMASEAVDLAALESEVYDHLYGFFRRYYAEGDFLSKRVYKAGVYAIPYEGEEVKLHWANADQYYIKTSEYLRDYAFRLRPKDDMNPLRVHFGWWTRPRGSTETSRRAWGARSFWRQRTPLSRRLTKQGRNSPSASSTGLRPSPTGPRMTAKAKRGLRRRRTCWSWRRSSSWLRTSSAWLGGSRSYSSLISGPTVKPPNTRACERISTATPHATPSTTLSTRTCAVFLRRELDFFIKNEVMHLDDVESETAPRVEQYLSKIKIIRRIAGKIIDFLAQLEDFQRKLWLKKKFVVETSWCIRVGAIPESLHAEIAANDAQRAEWVNLFAIDEIEGDLTTPACSSPLTPDFLKAHPTLTVDTRHFDAGFTARLLEAIGDLDEQTDGVLFHSENFQALSLMQALYREQVRCIYIDPPYNTGSDGFAYKDTYQHSSWQAMMESRLDPGRALLSASGAVLSSINDIELSGLRFLMNRQLGVENHVGTLVWKGATDNNPTRIAVEHEYVVCYAKSKDDLEAHWSSADNEIKQLMLEAFERFRAQANSLDELKALVEQFSTEHRERLGDLYRYRRVDQHGLYAARRNVENPGKPGYTYDVIHPASGKPCEKPYWGWRFPESTMKRLLAEDRIIFGDTETKIPELKVYLREVRFPLRSVFSLDARKGSNDLDRLFGSRDVFKNPKPVELLGHLLPFVSSLRCVVLDFFSGSGTTGHAVINLNREDGGRRKFILVEMADYFDTVLLPRMKKVTFAPEWKDGKPKRVATREEAERSPRVIKVVRLESYEDVLNNVETRRTEAQQSLLDAPEAQGDGALKEQYLLRYMLDVETRGSQSLLNTAAFSDPTAYRLKVKRPSSDESREVNVDLLETFNWLIGLTVRHVAAPSTFSAAFERDSEGRLRLKGRLEPEAAGPFWFRTVAGSTLDGKKTLVIWRKLTGNPEEDNLVLDEWFTQHGYAGNDREFDLVYVNGGNNLENLKAVNDRLGDTWKVRLIEEDFHRLMFEAVGT